jgi:hypothetical protein
MFLKPATVTSAALLNVLGQCKGGQVSGLNRYTICVISYIIRGLAGKAILEIKPLAKKDTISRPGKFCGA